MCVRTTSVHCEFTCVCVWEEEKGQEKERGRERARERESSLQDFASKHAGEKERVAPTSELLYCLFFDVW